MTTGTTKDTEDEDCWHGKIVVIDTSTGVGGCLWMPRTKTFRIMRNDRFLVTPYGGITCYQIEYYTGDMRDVWRSCWLLDGGLQTPAPSRHATVQSNVPVRCLEGYLPVALQQKKPDGTTIYVRHADRLRMEYHHKEVTGKPTDIVQVYFDYPLDEGGAASGPPH